MKFAKQLESEAEKIPSEWRPYLIRYKTLKKLISKVADEIEKRGLSADFLRECLSNGAQDNNAGPILEYYFSGEPPNAHPCIKFIYDPNQSRLDQLLGQILSKNADDGKKIAPEPLSAKPELRYKRTENDTDFYTLSKKPGKSLKNEEDVPERTSDDGCCSTEMMENDIIEVTSTSSDTNNELRSLVIELEHDDEFFHILTVELQQASVLQDMTKKRFEQDVNELERRMCKVAAPGHVADMYTWRAIFSLYMDAQIFKGKLEQDRSIRSIKRSKAQMEWFTGQLEEKRLVPKFKKKASRESFDQFIALNTELLTLKHYQLLNQTALTKILKKHDKRSGLNASTSFPTFLKEGKFFTSELSDILCASVLGRLMSIIPQPDDYLCPVCMSVAWRPIRLVCGHVYCVRCLIKAQKKGVDNCPLCRHPTAVKLASSLNLDIPMQNFLKLYFPKEIKEKKRDNEHEQAIEDIQAMTGRKYTEEQLMRMQSRSERACHIM